MAWTEAKPDWRLIRFSGSSLSSSILRAASMRVASTNSAGVDPV